MTKAALNFQSKSVAGLRSCIEKNAIQCLDLLTTILSLLLIEMTHGSSGFWRYHLEAASRYLRSEGFFELWSQSSDAWFAAQSFMLLITGGRSVAPRAWENNTLADGQASLFIAGLTESQDYGWTLGASNSVMKAIDAIQATAGQIRRKGVHGTAVVAPLHLTQFISECEQDALGTESDLLMGSLHKSTPEQLHLHAFKTATVIYYYQACKEVTPRFLLRYVRSTLDSLMAFCTTCEGAFTLWPLIVSGTEAYQQHHQDLVLNLLDHAAKRGIRDVTRHRRFIEQVWHIRETEATESAANVADVRVDWKDVIYEHSLDLFVF
ncbi:uncharacterized protein AB675_12182 [Cyphellophora attinorum]|uniref:Uncharacterized protein n=1 Tax=Cyphellophora attinorum TaxID=1664694 RepID=A0A0N0NKP1_9EURO|nr:uncharacterized protein AB675_12182 [Phialophora attinorum]KPI38258.1 hypothetical protein AB675_12182 [Phialophora attinorum]